MSKNITIQEGGVDYQFTAAKLKTNMVGGGTCLWVLEDEVALGAKSVTENGTYKASNDGKYGYSQVTVNVSGGQGSVNPDGTPNVNPVNPNDPDSKVNPGGPGTSVVGTDPVTGNDYIIGVDEDGQLVTTPVPSVIEITELPDKTDYTSGDPVDSSGLVAVLKNNDGTIFTNEDYPDGTIPISELLLPTTNVNVDETTESGMTSELETNIPQPIHVIPAGTYIFQTGEEPDITYFYFKYPGIACGSKDNIAGFGIILISPADLGDYHLYALLSNGDEVKLGGGIHARLAKTYDGKDAFAFGGGGAISTVGTVLVDPYPVVPDENSIWTALYGQDSGGKQTLPVQWKSPYDGRTLETSYEVTVDGSGFSDDSGGSESGGGTDIPGGGSSSDSGGSASGGGGNF